MDISEEELQLVEQLREKALDFVEKDEHKDEAFLIRWIRARDKDLVRAAESLMHSLEWRKEHDMDSLINLSIDPIFAEKYKRDLECHDKEGRPVISVPFGEWDVPFTVATQENTDNFRLYTLQGAELLMDLIKKADEVKKSAGVRINQCVLLIDMAGFSFMNLLNVYAVQNGLSLLSAYEAHYPETLHSCYLVNATSSIGMLLNLAKSVLAQRTYDKIKVFGADVEEWRTAILEIIEEDQLPLRFGGTKEVVTVDDVEEAEEVEEAKEADEDDDEFVEACEEL